MKDQLREHLHTYTSRRSPWGPPWWIYGVAFAAVNLVRQVVMVMADIPQAFRAVSWAAAALLVIVVVNSVAVVFHRGSDADRSAGAPGLAPLWPLRR